jgi:O-succinylbenzoate synthase
MRIDEVELLHIRMRLKHPFETSFGVELDRDCVILCVRSQGLEGWGECVASATPGYSYETVGTAWEMLREFFVPQIIGSQIANIELYRRAIAHLNGHNLARAGLEMAIWDLLAQAENKSLAEMLGGIRMKVSVGVSVGLKEDNHETLHVVEGYLAEGYQRIKLKIKPGKDTKLVRHVREKYPTIVLQVDANSAYSLEDIEIFTSLDEFDLQLIEQPLAEDDLIDHSRLQSKIRTPICLDESVRALRHSVHAVEIGACKIINIKPGRVGGLYEAKRIHDYCLGEDVPVWCGGMLETNIGRASNLAIASLPGFILPGDISASARYYDEDIAEPGFELNDDSTINVPEGPGLGVRVIPKSLDKFTLHREVFRA